MKKHLIISGIGISLTISLSIIVNCFLESSEPIKLMPILVFVPSLFYLLVGIGALKNSLSRIIIVVLIVLIGHLLINKPNRYNFILQSRGDLVWWSDMLHCLLVLTK